MFRKGRILPFISIARAAPSEKKTSIGLAETRVCRLANGKVQMYPTQPVVMTEKVIDFNFQISIILVLKIMSQQTLSDILSDTSPSFTSIKSRWYLIFISVHDKIYLSSSFYSRRLRCIRK
jgi:hypothetical protein